MTQFPETRESLIIQVKDPGNRDACDVPRNATTVLKPSGHR
jgi:hypothetical protein